MRGPASIVVLSCVIALVVFSHLGGCSSTGHDGKTQRPSVGASQSSTLENGANLLIGTSSGSTPGNLGIGATAVFAGALSTDSERATVRIETPAAGGQCSGALIADCVVLTAKHCIQPVGTATPIRADEIFVHMANDTAVSTPGTEPLAVAVQEVITTPGAFAQSVELQQGEDLAALVLATKVDETPYRLQREIPSPLTFRAATVVGFGRRAPGGNGGQRAIGQTIISDLRRDYFTTPAIACSGDSGGPLLFENGKLLAINSFSTDECGAGLNGYTRLDRHRALIDAALDRCGACDANRAELCPTRPAAPSADSVGPCNPLSPRAGCPAGFFCTPDADPADPSTTCAGRCVAMGEPPSSATAGLALGERCGAHQECDSLRCETVGTDARCVLPCFGDGTSCPTGSVCTGTSGSCGYCFPVTQDGAQDRTQSEAQADTTLATLVSSGELALGESCQAAGECASAHCLVDGEQSYCTRACDTETSCPERFTCRDRRCYRGIEGGLASPCRVNAGKGVSQDCAGSDARCLVFQEAAFCSRPCSRERPCPSGFSCGDAQAANGQGFCTPNLLPMGALCASPEQCITRRCARRDEASPQYCAQSCGVDLPCPVGFTCTTLSDQPPACLPTAAPRLSGGTCRLGTSPSPQLPWVSLFMMLLFVMLRGHATAAQHSVLTPEEASKTQRRR